MPYYNIEITFLPQKEATDEEKERVSHSAYERFKLHWMMEHNHSITDLLNRLSDLADEFVHDYQSLFGLQPIRDTFEMTGFNGEIWPCYSEFLFNEYQDTELMRELLPEEDWEIYLADTRFDEED